MISPLLDRPPPTLSVLLALKLLRLRGRID